jgi:hypothetical protein
LRVDRGQLEIELPGILRLEGRSFQFDHHVAAQLKVVEQQVNGQ